MRVIAPLYVPAAIGVSVPFTVMTSVFPAGADTAALPSIVRWVKVESPLTTQVGTLAFSPAFRKFPMLSLLSTVWINTPLYEESAVFVRLMAALVLLTRMTSPLT